MRPTPQSGTAGVPPNGSTGGLARLVCALACGLLLAACTGLNSNPDGMPPARLGLRLSPAALGTTISLQQHLKVERNGHIDELDAALEVDAAQLQLVGLAFGQRVLQLSYDGSKLASWRHPMLPAQLRAEDVLEDIELALWPVEALAAGLPPGWRIEESGLRRTVYLDGQPVTSIVYSGAPRWSGTVVLENFRYKYRLTIQSAP